MVTVAGIAIPDEIEIMIVACQTGEPAIGLYTKLGVREEVLHFDIAVGDGDGAA